MKLRVHPSIRHAQAMLTSIEKRTGKPLSGWVNLCKATDLSDNKSIIKWLRTEQGLGGPTAMVIASATLNQDEDFDAEAYIKRAPAIVDDQYAGKKAHLRPIADTLFRAIDDLGMDVAASPCKTYVPFYRQHVFAQVKAATQKRVDVGLALARYNGEIPDRLKDTGGKDKGDRITHVIAVSSLDEIDADLTKWLTAAYELDE